VKEYLSQKNISFEERDVAANPNALEELKRLRAMTTPVTVIGNQVVIGFDPDKLDAALGN